MKKISIVLFCFLFTFFVKGETLDDLISYNDRVEIIRGRINEVNHEFILIEALSNNSGLFKVVRINKIKEDRKINNHFLVKRKGRYEYVSLEKRIKIKRRRKQEDIEIEKSERQINNVTKTVNTMIYIEDVNIKNATTGDIFTFSGKTLYQIGSIDVNIAKSNFGGNSNWGGGRGGFRGGSFRRGGFSISSGRKNVHRFTLSKEKAKKYLNSK